MSDSILLAGGKTLDETLAAFSNVILGLQNAVAANQKSTAASLAAISAVMQANQTADQTAITALQSALASWIASKPSGGGTITGGATGGGTTPTSGGGATTLPSTTANPENLSLSIQPGIFTFSNIPVGNNTICIVEAKNSKARFPAWSIVRSSVKLAIDYAGYVHCMEAPGAGPINFTVQCVDGTSMVQATFSIPVVQIGAQTATRAPGAYVGLTTTGLVKSNSFLTGSAGIVGFNIANDTAAKIPTGYVRFVQVFTPGAVPKGSTIGLVAPGGNTPIQCDPINTYSDGSTKTAIITVGQSGLDSGVSVQFLLGAVTQTAFSPIDLASTLTAAKYALTFNIQMLTNDVTPSGSPVAIDLGAAMQAALTAKTARLIQSGPLVTQSRVVVPITGSLYLNADFSAFSDGQIRCDIAVRNDVAMSSSGGPIYTSGSITQNGTEVYAWTQLYQTQYQAWFFECGTEARYPASVQLDPAYLIKTAAIQPYNLANGIEASTIVGYEKATTSAGWLEPLNPNYVDTGMPGTGGRPDIGWETQSATVALITQDSRAVDYCCAWADASGSAPWNYFDAANG